MNQIYYGNMRRALRPRAPAACLVASVVLGALLGTSAYASDMYHAPEAEPGGVRAQSTVTSITPAGTNTTVCWYGMQGWYTVEATTNVTTGPWLAAGRTAASAHAWCMTVPNPDPTNNYFFRLNQNNGFVGSGACAGCHGDKYGEWVKTGHSTALNSLAQIGMDKNPACLECHTVGFGQPTGYTDSIKTPQLSNVGCENCHGPAAWHKYSDHDLIHPALSIDPKICGGCHQDSHHPTFEEYETTLHAEVNDDIKYGVAGGVYYPGTFVTPSNTWYGYYVTTNSNGTLKTNQTTGIIHSLYGPANNQLYDPGQDRQVGCGICHAAATRMAQLNDYEARLKGYTNALVFPSAKDASSWSAACATCHDPHSDENPAQLRNPTRSTNYYTMPTTSDKRTVYSTNFQGGITTNVVFYSAAFANMYDPDVQICAQCHNSRGARWDGRSFGYFNATTLQSANTPGPGIVWGVQTNFSFSRPPHHSPQYNVLIGILQSDYFNTNSSGVATNWIQRHGAGVSTSNGNYNTNQCATCHVPNYAVSSTTNVTGHKFELDTKNCTLANCHGSVPLYEETMLATTNSITRIVSLLNQWGVSKGTALGLTKGANNWDYTTTGALAPTPNTSNAGPGAGDQLKIPDPIKQARFNIYMVLHDGSLGVHNPRYASALTADAENKVLSQFPMANFRAYTTSGFTNLAVGFTNMGTGATSWSWDFGDGNTSTLQNPTNVYTTSGVFHVRLTATGPGGNETVVRSNYVTVAIRPTVTFTGSPRSGPSPLLVNFTNTSVNTDSVTLWRWSIDGQVFYSQDTSYTFTNAFTTNRTFNISLRGYTSGGNVTTTSNNFITVTPPVP